MNKVTIFMLLLIAVLLLLNFSNKSRSNDSLAAETKVEIADRLEIVNFFGTQRCVSCLTIGKFTKKTLETKFAPELESGKIIFKEINGELPENREIAAKYQARGSSLFINAIRDEQDYITEDVTVWRLVGSEAQFSSYLENKINKLLGK